MIQQPPQTATHRRLAREAILLFIAILSLFLLTINGHDNSEESWYSYQVANQILTHHSIGFDDPQKGVFNEAPDGRYYEAYGLGNSLFMLPVTWLDNAVVEILRPRIGDAKASLAWRFVLACLSPIYCAAGLALIYALLRIFFLQGVLTAVVNVLILGFCSYYWNYSRNLTDPVLCCLLLCAATLLLFLYSRTFKRFALILAFVIFGLSVITRLTMMIPVAAAFLYLALIFGRNWKGLMGASITAGATLVPFLAWELYYNHLRTGHPLVSPLMAFYRSDNGLTGPLLPHALGLLISPGKGILVYVPPALLALFCFPDFFRRFRTEALYVAAIGLGWLLFHAKLANNWFGAWGWGPRHFITIAPILAIPFLVSGRRVFSSAPKKVFAVLCLAFGFVLATAATIGDWLYRLGFVTVHGGYARLVWNPTQNQSVDMIVSSARNIARLFTNIPYDILPGTSPMNQRASNTVNIWLVTAYHEGVPAVLVLLAAVLLAAAAVAAFWLLLRGKPAD